MDSRLAVRAAHAFDGERFLPGGALVLVDDGRVTAVEPGAAEVPTGWPLLEVPGATLLPGLVDAHVHLCCDSRGGALDRLAGHSEAEEADVIDMALRRQLAAGVTAVRDLGDRQFVTLGWRQRPGLPAVTVSGPPITVPEGHCWNMGGAVRGAGQIRAAIDERDQRGVDVVKIMASGGINTQGTDVAACQFPDPDLRLLVDLAHAANLPVTVHAHALPAVEQAIAAGADGIEHCTCLTAEGVRLSRPVLDRLAASRVVVCPTIGITPGIVPPERIREQLHRFGLSPESRARDAATMAGAGVTLVSGGDSGINEGKPHGLLPWSVLALVSAGVALEPALASATSIASAACGFGTAKGRLRPGSDADLLLVDGDLAADPAVLTRPAAVVLRGVVVESSPNPSLSGSTSD